MVEGADAATGIRRKASSRRTRDFGATERKSQAPTRGVRARVPTRLRRVGVRPRKGSKELDVGEPPARETEQFGRAVGRAGLVGARRLEDARSQDLLAEI